MCSAVMVVAMQLSGLSGKVALPARPSTSLSGRRVAAPSNGCRVSAKKVGNWLPGSDTPAYLNDLPAYVVGVHPRNKHGLRRKAALAKASALNRLYHADPTGLTLSACPRR